MPIKTQSAKAKGRNHQTYIKELIMTELGDVFKFKEGDVDTASMGAQGVDIKLSPLVREYLPVSIEAKATKKHPSQGDMRQARSNTYVGTYAAVAWKPHGAKREDTMIAMNLRDFLVMVRELILEPPVPPNGE